MISIGKESEFQTYFTRTIKHFWWWIYKMPDIWNVQKPFDSFIAYKWFIKAAELKIAPTYKTNVFRLLKDHQVTNLQSLYPNWYVVCYYKKEKATSVFQMQPDASLKEVIHLQKLSLVCQYLLWIN